MYITYGQLQTFGALHFYTQETVKVGAESTETAKLSLSQQLQDALCIPDILVVLRILVPLRKIHACESLDARAVTATIPLPSLLCPPYFLLMLSYFQPFPFQTRTWRHCFELTAYRVLLQFYSF